ncbi:hypothetical protein [Bacillus niameyensis]|uniref:hypothetical protein n=1 Tax=Bacillus niameyensis TaxID=1522308 RepID=UPI0007852E44|nr:hypothetical protein [Bacillus niameyensis]
MKKIFFLFVILIGLVGSLLVYQWNVYSSGKNNDETNATQNFRIQHRKGMFHIEQTLSNLNDQNYKIIQPKNIEDIQCFTNDETSCFQGSANVEVKNGELKFTYSIKAPNKSESFLWELPYIKLKDVQLSSTHIQLNEFDWRDGEWVSEADRQVRKKMNLLDYYVFDQTPNVPALYWQSKQLEKIEVNQNLVIFTSPELKKSLDFKRMDVEKLNKQQKYVVITDEHKETVSGRLHIMNKPSNKEALERELMLVDLESSYSFAKNEKWLQELIVAIMNDSPPKGEKAKKMFTEWSNTLTKEQIKLWKDLFQSIPEGKLDSVMLDEVLSEATGHKVIFFVSNANEQNPFSPIIFYDSRDVFVKDVQLTDIYISHVKDKSIIELLPLLKALNYSTHIKDQTFIAEKGAIQYQFYPDKRYFDLNGDRYGSKNPVIVTKNGQSFIELYLIETLFNVEIVEEEGKISIE